jgi:long-chain fatty acid transport protein
VPQNVSTLIGQLAPVLGLNTANLPFQTTSGTADFTTPAVATTSYWHQEDKFGFGADVAWTEWDVFKNLTVNYGNPAQPQSTQAFNWHNSYYASFGGEYYLTDKFTVRGGIGFDTTPTSAPTREVRVPDETRKLASVGIGYKATEHFSINASYAHIFVNRASIDNDVSATEDAITGTSSDYGNLFALSGVYKF